MIGPAAVVDVVARRVATHPEARLHLVGYLSAPRDEDATRGRRCRGSARSRTSRGSPASTTSSGSSSTEQEMSERGGRAPDRGVQGGRAGAHLPAQALRPARPRDRAQPPRRAAGARLPLLRPAALDPGAEAGTGRVRLGPDADDPLAAAGPDRALHRTTGGSATAPSTSCPRWSRPASSAPSSSTACWR